MNPVARFIAGARAQPGVRRELLLLILALLAGVIAVPWAIWAAGQATLGEYSGGGPFDLWGDFFRGLAAGGAAFWTAALGPYVLLLVLRLLLRLFRRPSET
jgi:hypothetical protein